MLISEEWGSKLMLIWWTHMNIVICFFPINIYSIPIIRTKYTYIYIYSKLYVQNIFILFPNYTYKIYIFIPNNTYKINIFFPNYTYEYMFQIIRTKYIYICFWHESTKTGKHGLTFLTQIDVFDTDKCETKVVQFSLPILKR